MTEENMQEMFENAQDLLEDGDLESALEHARLLLAADDENPVFWCLEGQIHMALDEEGPAERAFNRACQLAPQHPEPLFHKAHYHLFLEEFDEAYRLTEQALQYADDDEDRFSAHFLLGESQYGHAQALIMDWLEELFELEEQSVSGGGQAINVELEGELPPLPPEIVALLEKSLAATEKAISIRDNIAEGWDLKARCHVALMQLEDALDAWEKALDIEPYESSYWHLLATTHLELEDYEAASEAFRKLYDLEMEDPEGMELSREEFEEIAVQACQDLEADLHEHLEMPLVLRVAIEDFPDEEYLDEAPSQEPFDPWIPCLISTPNDSEASQTIEFLLFQRNIEREANSDDPHVLYHYLSELLAEVFQQLFAHMDEDEPIEA